MATLVTSGRTAIADSIRDGALFMGWGAGLVAWDTAFVTEDSSKTQLVTPVGYRKLTESAFCTPNANGTIVVPTGNFNVSQTPTNHLYLRFTFDFDDAPTAQIRETAVFLGTVTDPALPLGQMYFSPAQVTNPGTMLVAENVPRINRTAATRETFEFVVTF
jgi:hypothetical protein